MQRSIVMEKLPRPRQLLSRPVVARSPVAVQCCFMSASRSISTSKCPYRILGVRHDADEETIKAAFRRKAKQMHPDVSGDPITTLAFMECQHAYQTLVDPEKRAKYDKTLLPRGNSQVLSYLNARSAARHGIVPSRMPCRATYTDRPELYSTMLDLLAQVKSCAKHLEREIVGKDGARRDLPPMPPAEAAAAAALSPRPCASAKRAVLASDAECGEHECGEPWIYYAAQPVVEKAAVAAARQRR